MEERASTLVIGAGPAGLAVAGCLKARGAHCILLERSTEIAASWRRHYDRLHLHTAARHSSLPGLAFPSGTPRYPSRDQVVGYLESYAQRFGIVARLGEDVVRLRSSGGEWSAETAAGLYRSRQVVVATGLNAIPWRPDWPGQERFRGPILHSGEYRNGEPFRDKHVLVVGFGNSAGEIAIDLHEHGARPAMAVRGPVNIVPRDILGIPVSSISLLLSRVPPRFADALAPRIARLTIGDIRRFGLTQSTLSPMTQIRTEARIPLIDIGTLDLIRRGLIRIRPCIRSLADGEVIFADGSRDAFDAIIAATGFRPAVGRFLDPTVDRDGQSARDAGARWPSSRVESTDGLYFCGFTVSPAGMLREIGIEARRIAAHIVRSRQ